MKRSWLFIQIIVISLLVSMATLGLGYYFMLQDLPTNSSTSPQTSEPVTATENSEQNIPQVVENSIPAVVSVIVSADVPVVERYYDEFWSPFGDVFGGGMRFPVPRERQIGTEHKEIAAGTGFFVSADGYLVTNKHVVDQEGVEYSVVTNDEETYTASVVAKDPVLDVAILKVEAETDFPFLSFADLNNLQLGQTVIAIGNALAEFPNSVSVGVVSGLSRDIVASDGFRVMESLEGVIQTDAAINRGNSGGPLLNTAGKVVGVNVAAAGQGENIGFALPGNVVKSVYESVMEHGEVVRPFLGVRYQEITEDMAEQNNLPVNYGVIITRGENPGELAVIPGSPADKAGLEENDIILKVDGEKLDGSPSLSSLLRQYEVGAEVELEALHDGETKMVTVELGKF